MSEQWTILYSRQAQKDSTKLAGATLKVQASELLDLIARDPFATPPPVKRLRGDLAGYYSRRINRQHRLVYSVDAENRIVRVVRMWTRYGE